MSRAVARAGKVYLVKEVTPDNSMKLKYLNSRHLEARQNGCNALKKYKEETAKLGPRNRLTHNQRQYIYYIFKSLGENTPYIKDEMIDRAEGEEGEAIAKGFGFFLKAKGR